MKIAINSLTFKEDTIPFYQKLFKLLGERDCEIFLHKDIYSYLGTFFSLDEKIATFQTKEELGTYDFMFSIGGDGTLLDSVTYTMEQNIPILGINTGRLGFLAASTKENIEATITQLFDQTYKIEERILLQLDSNLPLFKDFNYALNDFSILKRDSSSMIIVHTYINGEFLNSYWADGIVVSTPTGSTAYSLSCGGPVVMPHSNNFVIAPVCPHNLNVRPIVVPDDSVISFKIEGRNENYQVTMDSRSEIVDDSVEISVKKGSFTAKIITTNEYNYLSTLRKKLSWGIDVRN